MSEHMQIPRKRETATTLTTAQSGMLQRSATTPEQAVEEVPLSVQEVLSSSGQPLDSDTRAFMEPRFGHDFSKVRVHTDERAVESAQAVNALAYTVGQNVAFGQGQYAPQSSEGKRLLAHELTHVVQQEVEPMAGTTTMSGFSISNPADSQELAANEVANRVMAENEYTTENIREASSATSASNMVIQRFQAGDTGHGGIEKAGLGAAGFSPADVSKIYLGNWLRDFSQFPAFAFPLVKVLALGEFGVPITQDQLGTYVPSEHLDNPAGGGSNEDPQMSGRRDSGKAFDKLSSDQKAAYEDEQAHLAEVQAAAASSGLPEYIEMGKYHAKKELASAVNLGKTDEGMQAMGNGLHAIEDYFAHSNFIEVAIGNLPKGVVTPTDYKNLVRSELGRDGAMLGGSDPVNAGEPAIITGTYATIYDNVVSLLEQVCTEVKQGQLTKAFVVGTLMEMGIDIPGLAKSLGMTQEELEKIAINSGKQELDKLVDTVGIRRLLAAFPEITVLMDTAIAAVKMSVEGLQKAATLLAHASASDKKLSGPTHSEIAKDSPDHHLYSLARSLAVYVDEKIGEAMKAAWETVEKAQAAQSMSTQASPLLVESVTSLVDQFVSHPSRDSWWQKPLTDELKTMKE